MGSDANDSCLHLVVCLVQDVKVCSAVCGELRKCDENHLEEAHKLALGGRFFVQSELGRLGQSFWSVFCCCC